MKFFCVSDIHSYFSILKRDLAKAGFDENNPEHTLCILGDLFDRGNESLELFEFVKSLKEKNRLIYIKGNHEDLLEECIEEIKAGRVPSSHHFSNETIKTICSLCKESEYIIYDPERRKKIPEILQTVLYFINENCVDYAEIGDYVLVHGWIPSYYDIPDFRNANKSEWKRARWLNGMDMWLNPRNRLEGKTIMCGHWNCSWGWSHIRMERKEFPPKNRKDWEKSFEPFVDDGIIAIDAATPYSEKVNVVVLEEENQI